MSINGSVISDNTVSYAVIKNALGGNEFDITNTVINSNGSTGSDHNYGYIFYNLGVMNLKDIIFNDNVSNRHTLFLNTNRFNIDGLSIRGNESLESIFKNSSETTGAILSVKNATISNVKTTNDMIRNDAASTINIENSYFENCESTSGSMIYNMAGATIKLKNVEMVDNKLNTYFINHTNGTTTLENTRLARNNGLESYIVGQSGTINITNSKIDNNTMSNDIFNITSARLNIKNTDIVANNSTANIFSLLTGATLTTENMNICDNIARHVIVEKAGSRIIASATEICRNIINGATYETTTNCEFIEITASTFDIYGDMNIFNNTLTNGSTWLRSMIYVNGNNSSLNIKNGAKLHISSNDLTDYFVLSVGISNTAVLNIEENGSIDIENNNLKITNTPETVRPAIIYTQQGSNINNYGDMTVKDNHVKCNVTGQRNYSALRMTGNNSFLNIGSGATKIYSPIATATNVKTFGVYSTKDIFIKQIAGTTFNENNYFADIIITDDTAVTERTGTIMSTGFVKSTEVAEKSFKASTYSNVDFVAYKGNSNNVIIGVRKVKFEFNPPAGTTLINDLNYPSHKNIGGAILSKIDRATFRVDGYSFIGWNTVAKTPSATGADEVEVTDGGYFSTPFGTNQFNQEWTLYGYWGRHVHKICGVASGSVCNHDNAHLGTHSTVMQYEELRSTTSITEGKGYYLNGNLTLNKAIEISGTVYICLNGWTLTGARFVALTANSTVYICNCRDAEASVIDYGEAATSDDSMFNGMNAYVYGSGGKINFRTKIINSRGSTIVKRFEVYNAHFKSVDGYINASVNQALVGQNDAAHKTVMSKVIFEGYNTTILLSNNAPSFPTATFKIYDVKFVNNIITGRGMIHNDYGTFTAENVVADNTTIGSGASMIYQYRASGTINISSASILNTNNGSATNGTMVINHTGTTNIAYAYANIHDDFMKDRITLIGCPKLDAIDYSEKLTEVLKSNDISDVLMLRMQVPCCGGLQRAVENAINNSGKSIPYKVVTISREGNIVE